MKIILIFFSLLLVCSTFVRSSFALDTYIYEIPNPRLEKLWVTDLADIIDFDAENQLNQILTEFNHKYRSEIFVVTVSDISPYQSAWQLTKYIFNIGQCTESQLEL